MRFENLREHDINQDCARTHLPQPLHCQRLLAGRLTARPNSWQLCWGCLQAADIDVSCAACRSLRGRICGSASKSLLRRGSRSRRRRSTLRTSRRALQNRLCTHVLASEWVLLLAAPRTVAGEARDSTLQTTCAWLHIKLITSRAVCHTCCCARARALMATSLKWPATSCVIRKRRMPTPDPPVHDLAPVPMRAGTRIGTTTRLLRRARAQGDCGCALSDAWFSECRFHADCGIERDGALAAARCGFV